MENPRGDAFSGSSNRRFNRVDSGDVYIQTQDQTLVFCGGYAGDTCFAGNCGTYNVFCTVKFIFHVV